MEHFSYIPDLNEQDREKLKIVVLLGIQSGWSYKKLAKTIQEQFPQYERTSPKVDFAGNPLPKHIGSKALLIAVTELGNFSEERNYKASLHLHESGIRMIKKWVTVGDEFVSEVCRQNEKEGWIPIEQSHASGHLHPLSFPGCRCGEQYKRE